MLLTELKNMNEMQAASSITGFKKKKINKIYILCFLFGVTVGIGLSYYFWKFLIF